MAALIRWLCQQGTLMTRRWWSEELAEAMFEWMREHGGEQAAQWIERWPGIAEDLGALAWRSGTLDLAELNDARQRIALNEPMRSEFGDRLQMMITLWPLAQRWSRQEREVQMWAVSPVDAGPTPAFTPFQQVLVAIAIVVVLWRCLVFAA